MRLSPHPTQPLWQVFSDEDGSLLARGHLEIRSVPAAPHAITEVMFVPDWVREDPHPDERSDGQSHDDPTPA